MTSCLFLTYSQVPLPMPVPVIQVACGNSHSLALTTGKILNAEIRSVSTVSQFDGLM